MFTCDGVRNRLERFVDGELKENERLGVEAHLLVCDACERAVERLTTIREAFRESVHNAMNNVDLDSIWQKVEARIDEPVTLSPWQRAGNWLDDFWGRLSPVLVPTAALAGAVALVWLLVSPGNKTASNGEASSEPIVVKIDPGGFTVVTIEGSDGKIIPVFVDDPPAPPTVSGPH